MSIFKLFILPIPSKEQTKPVVMSVIISQGKMELKEVSYTEISYEDGAFDKVSAANCIYFWPDPVADLKDNLSDIQPNCLLNFLELVWRPDSCRAISRML